MTEQIFTCNNVYISAINYKELRNIIIFNNITEF